MEKSRVISTPQLFYAPLYFREDTEAATHPKRKRFRLSHKRSFMRQGILVPG